jgi:succinate dehydrogenase/fumarate reductase flavoprotein subunit
MTTASEPLPDRTQIEAEKKRLYAHIKNPRGMEWKELNNGITKVMQDYCGDIKSEEALKIGLTWFKEIRESEAAQAYARNPHELMHVMECLSLIDRKSVV